jgi:hypothetical protein
MHSHNTHETLLPFSDVRGIYEGFPIHLPDCNQLDLAQPENLQLSTSVDYDTLIATVLTGELKHSGACRLLLLVSRLVYSSLMKMGAHAPQK